MADGEKQDVVLKLPFTERPKNIYELLWSLVWPLTILVAIVLVRVLTPPGGKTEVGFSEWTVTAEGKSTSANEAPGSRLFEFWTPSSKTRNSFCGSDLDKASGRELPKKDTVCRTQCIQESKSGKIHAADRWECSVGDEQVKTFGDRLLHDFQRPAKHRLHIFEEIRGAFIGSLEEEHARDLDEARDPDELTGFRRFEVEGVGKSGLKRGWWWVLTVNKDFDRAQFARTYIQFWCGFEKENQIDCQSKPVFIEEISGSTGYANSK